MTPGWSTSTHGLLPRRPSSIDPSPLAARAARRRWSTAARRRRHLLRLPHYIVNTAAAACCLPDISSSAPSPRPVRLRALVDSNRAYETADATGTRGGTRCVARAWRLTRTTPCSRSTWQRPPRARRQPALMLHMATRRPPSSNPSRSWTRRLVTHSTKASPSRAWSSRHARQDHPARGARARRLIESSRLGQLFLARRPRPDEQGYWPDTISTDAHHGVVDPPISADMPNVMSKFSTWHATMDVIRASTIGPARPSDGTTASVTEVGAPPTCAVLALEDGEFPLSDAARLPRPPRADGGEAHV